MNTGISRLGALLPPKPVPVARCGLNTQLSCAALAGHMKDRSCDYPHPASSAQWQAV